MAGRRTMESAPDSGCDRLGKSLATYSSHRSGILTLIGAVIAALTGAFVLGDAGRLAHKLAESDEDTLFRVAGWALMIVGSLAAGAGVLQLGRRFEVRRKGVRFARRSVVQELRWDEIDDIQVRKTITWVKGQRIISWEIELIGDSDTIYLNEFFLRQISSVTELVSLLKNVSGKEIDLPPLH